jgi:hypothetical protein
MWPGKPRGQVTGAKGGTFPSSSKYRTATILPANKRKWQMLDQEVYGFGTLLYPGTDWNSMDFRTFLRHLSMPQAAFEC